MDYEKKYNAALERARQFSEYPLLEDSATIVEYIFPELKESEDEKIRKWLEGLIEAMPDNSIEFKELRRIDVLHWLEEQGKKLDADEVIEWIDELVPTKFEDMQNYVKQFKKDFRL